MRELYYVASTPYGDIHLSTPCRTADRSSSFAPIDHALGLAAIEERVERLENWLDCPLALEPAESVPSRSASLLALVDATAGSGALEVYVQTARWTRLPAPLTEEDAAPYKLGWRQLQGRLVIAELTLDAEDFDALGSNALVLIPESFAGDGWSARIEIPSMALSMQGTFDAADRRWTKVLDAGGLHLAELRERPTPAPPSVGATIGLSLPLSALECIGSAGLVSIAVGTARLGRPWEIAAGDGLRLPGRLVPSLTGHGFKIDPPADPVKAAPRTAP